MFPLICLEFLLL